MSSGTGNYTSDPDTYGILSSPDAKKYKADAFFLLTALLIVKVLLLRAIRHRRAWASVSFLLLAAGYLSNPAINYVLGLLSDSAVISRVTVMWAVFLVVLDGAADNTVSQSLEDNESNRKRFLWDKMLPSLWLMWVIFFTYPINAFWIPILLLWALFLLKLKEKKLALIYACRSRLGLDRVATIIVEYMKGECTTYNSTGDGDAEDATTIQDYKYLVGVKEALQRVGPSVYPPIHKEKLRPDDLATIDKIWQCEGKLLRSEFDMDGHLKDTCLSFALFWRLLPRFADYELPEASRAKEWMFVRDVLLLKEAGCERVFRVVERELQFLRDYFYTNYFATYSSGAGFLLLRVVVLACYLQVSFITLKEVTRLKKQTGSTNWYHIDNLQYTITKIVIYSLSVVELVHIVNMITSRWNKMKWVCSYVQNRWWESRCLGKVKEWLLCQLCHQPFFRPLSRPWHRKLRQYSLLESYNHTPIQLRLRWILNGYMELPMIGQKESPPTNLSTHVMEAVVLSIRTNGQKLSNGLDSLRRNEVYNELSWACISKEITRVILVWHIATGKCEEDRTKESCYTPLQSYCSSSSTPEDPNVRVATSLSKYCAYLVAFVPKLLPDHVYMTQWIFEQAVSEAREELKTQCCGMFNTKTTSGQGSNSEEFHCLEEGENLMKMGLCLEAKMMKYEESKRWKVLADFWVELILFLGPSVDANEHAKHLVHGGEFITHLWALLTHAGIVDRVDPDDNQA